jgi:predicted GH43/DUF377 family glycosyl hydrolase
MKTNTEEYKIMPKVTKKKKLKTKPTKKQVKKRPVVKKIRKTNFRKKIKKILKPKPKVKKKILKKKAAKKPKAILERHINNPIIKPSFYPWESKATFNPTAFQSDGKVHIIYRAIGDNDSSVLGYASSYDGLNIEERPTHAIYQRFYETSKIGEPIDYVSGGGWGGGCEDPRVTLIDDTIYMLYTAFDGWGSVRIAMASILLSDFKKKKWNWSRPVLISPPNEINKNWVLFPEKINGKFAILHSISPEILIDYVDDFRHFDGNKFIKSYHTSEPPWGDSWDNMVRGVGPAPIKTEIGWLLLYHSMDKDDPDRYKLGALILDLKNPKKILYHSKHPILEPNVYYENEGYKSGVIYSCGAVVKDGTLFVYYGGADKFTCVATIELSELLDSLKEDKRVKLKNSKIIKKI